MAISREQVERLGVFISALGLAFSIFWSAITTSQQAEALKLQTSATEHQVTTSMIVYATESARRFEEARAAKAKAELAGDAVAAGEAETAMQIELSSLLFGIDAYLSDLDSLSIPRNAAARRLADGALRVLASGVPCGGNPEPIGPRWAQQGFTAAGARAGELNLMTC